MQAHLEGVKLTNLPPLSLLPLSCIGLTPLAKRVHWGLFRKASLNVGRTAWKDVYKTASTSCFLWLLTPGWKSVERIFFSSPSPAQGRSFDTDEDNINNGVVVHQEWNSEEILVTHRKE